jgi:hypothetical protein
LDIKLWKIVEVSGALKVLKDLLCCVIAFFSALKRIITSNQPTKQPTSVQVN